MKLLPFRFGGFNFLCKLSEKVRSIVRTGGCFGMVLNAEGRMLPVTQSRHCPIVEVDVGDLDAFRQGIGIDRIPMVLRGNGYFSCAKILDRLIRSGDVRI